MAKISDEAAPVCGDRGGSRGRSPGHDYGPWGCGPVGLPAPSRCR